MGIFGDKTYSQHGEDLFLCNLANLLEIEKPSYLDLGAHHPTEISNTALLYKRGSRGVNVEANPYLIGAFIKERPEDINIQCGVAVNPGRQTFYMYDKTSGLNSFQRGEIEKVKLKAKEKMEIECLTLEDIVNQGCGGRFPDFLLTDIEGLDLPVLSSIPRPGPLPKIIMAEVRLHQSDEAKSILLEKGFDYHCRIVSNMVFVRIDLLDKVNS